MDYPKSVPNVGLVNGKFVDENTTTGQVGSLIPSAWGVAVTDEILAVQTEAGLAPEEGKNNQLVAAIKKLIAGVSFTWASITGKPTTVQGFGISDALKIKVAVQGDLNTYTLDCRGSGSGLTNAPFNDAGFWYLDVQAHGTTGAYCRQRLSRVVGSVVETYERHLDNGTWRAWVLVLTGASLASEAAAGLAKIATQPLVDAGVDDSTFVTPKKLRFGITLILGPNGAVAFPSWLGGLVIQWGTVSGITPDNSLNVSFPMAFTTACYSLTSSVRNAPGTTWIDEHSTLQWRSVSNSGFVACRQQINDAGSAAANWAANYIAIGK